MKNTYFMKSTTFNGEPLTALYCLNTDQIFIEDGGDGTSSECEDWEVVAEYASKIFETKLADLNDVALEIICFGEIFDESEDKKFGSGAAAWIAAQEE